MNHHWEVAMLVVLVPVWAPVVQPCLVQAWVGSYGSAQYDVPGPAGYSGSGRSSIYRLPPTSVEMPSSGYPEGRLFGLLSST